MKKELIPNDVMTDRQLIVRVFNKLRKQGFVALTKAACCQGCSWSMLDKKYKGKIPENVVFFHDQDADAFNRFGRLERPLYITHKGDARRIVAALVDHGFQASWPDSDPNKRIVVTGRRHPESKTISAYIGGLSDETVGSRYIKMCLDETLRWTRAGLATEDEQKQAILVVLRELTHVADTVINDVKKL